MPRKMCAFENMKSKNFRTTKIGYALLCDLAPHDKAKVAKLVDQIIELGKENNSLKVKLSNLEKRETTNLSNIEASLSESIIELKERIYHLETHRTDSLQLLHLYQQKISHLVVENQSKQRLVQDANSKISQQLAQIRDLEKLVLDQHSMIDSIQKMHCLSDNYQQQLISTQQELQTVYTENDILQKKCRKLEDDSKYLANQIDELLPQLFMKNSKIERLEQELFEVKSRQGHDVVDCATQFDCSSNVTDRSVQCSLGIDLFESANASPPLRVHDPSNTTITSFDDHRASDSHLQALMNPVKSEQREKLDAPIKVRKMKSKVEARRNQPITIQAKNTPKQPQSLEFPQSVPELSCHNDIYNQSMEIYSSSLFDLVEKMEVLESTLLPSTSGRKNQR